MKIFPLKILYSNLSLVGTMVDKIEANSAVYVVCMYMQYANNVCITAYGAALLKRRNFHINRLYALTQCIYH